MRRYEEGDGATAIAKSLNVAPSALIRLRRERGLLVRKVAVSTERGKQMAREYEAGTTMAGLEKKNGLSRSVVHRALHRAGIEPRKTGRPSLGGRPPLVK